MLNLSCIIVTVLLKLNLLHTWQIYFNTSYRSYILLYFLKIYLVVQHFSYSHSSDCLHVLMIKWIGIILDWQYTWWRCTWWHKLSSVFTGSCNRSLPTQPLWTIHRFLDSNEIWLGTEFHCHLILLLVYWSYRKKSLHAMHTSWKVSVFENILASIFPHLDWKRIDTPYLSVFSPNTGKYAPE